MGLAKKTQIPRFARDDKKALFPQPVKPVCCSEYSAGLKPRPLKHFQTFLRLAFLLLFAFALAASASARQLKIEKFTAEIFVQPDSTLDVTETIEVNFIGAWHGLYRTIPVEYVTPQGFNYSLFVKLDERDRRRRSTAESRILAPGPLPEMENLHR